MKKIKHLAITVLISLLLSGFVGCKSNSDDGTIPDADDVVSALQALIDNATEGSTVKLDSSLEGTVLKISKKLTIDGNNLENLSLIVNPDVASNVKLKNFVKASISILNSGSDRSVRAAGGARNAGSSEKGPKEIGDRNPKLYIENCSFEKFSAEDDLTLYMDPDAKKSMIKELELKAGAENFVVIEEEEEDLAKAKKSIIEKLIIEKGVDEVDIAGAYYNDIEFKGNFSGDKVDLYYDKKGDQIKAEFEAKLAAEAAKVNAKDICTVKNGNGKYKFTLQPSTNITDYNGAVSIILLKDSQRDAFVNSQLSDGWTWANLSSPFYDVKYTGMYLFDTSDEDVHPIWGGSTEYYHIDYDNRDNDYTEDYEYYKTYTKEAVCSQKNSDGSIDVYLDLANVIKSDLSTCAFEANGMNDEYYMTPRKLTEIDLAGYKPYIFIDATNYLINKNGADPYTTYQNEDMVAVKNVLPGTINTQTITPPISKSNGNFQGFLSGFIAPMETSETYPDVSTVQYTTKACPATIN